MYIPAHFLLVKQLLAAVIMVRMTMAPIPVCPLLLLPNLSKGPVLSVMLLEIPAISTIFVIVPIVIVLVITVVDPVAVLIVSMTFFLTSVVLRLARSIHC